MWNVSTRKSIENMIQWWFRSAYSANPWHVILSFHCRLSIPSWKSRERRQAELVLSLTSPANSCRRRRNSVSFDRVGLSTFLPRTFLVSPLLSYRTAIATPRGRNFAVETDTDPTGNPSRKFHVYIGMEKREGAR